MKKTIGNIFFSKPVAYLILVLVLTAFCLYLWLSNRTQIVSAVVICNCFFVFYAALLVRRPKGTVVGTKKPMKQAMKKLLNLYTSKVGAWIVYFLIGLALLLYGIIDPEHIHIALLITFALFNIHLVLWIFINNSGNCKEK